MSGLAEELERAGINVLERGWLSSNNILLRGDDNNGSVLVDTGYWTHAEQTIALLRHALCEAPLTRIINTHLHSDHCGGNAQLQRAFNCPIDIPEGAAAAVDAWDEDALTYKATGQYCPRFQHTGLLTAPGFMQAGRWRWEVIHSPGHDPKAVALYQPELEVLISADALWQNGFGVVFPELEGDEGFGEVGATLDAFSRLSVRHVIPGHGPVFTDMPAAIANARRRLDAFIADPRKHAVHAAKVLIKFRLLETQDETWGDFSAWLDQVRYFDVVHARYFEREHRTEWLTGLVRDMCRRGTLAWSDGLLRNGN